MFISEGILNVFMATTWPSVAYHFHLDKEVTIADAIKMRENGNPRAGDIWCHADCYKKKPRAGNKLFPRDRKSRPHYWLGAGEGHMRDVNCKYERAMNRNDETYRFAQFYHDLLAWLNSGDGDPNPRELFHISEVKESISNDADIVISHAENTQINWTETRILIVDKNRKRKNNEYTLAIDISQWTDSQLVDFNNSGIRKIVGEWDQLLIIESERGRQWRERAQADAAEEKWIEDNHSFILQARALLYVEKLKHDGLDKERKKLQSTVGSQTDERMGAMAQLEIGDKIREIKRLEQLLKLNDVQVAKAIRRGHEDVKRQIARADPKDRMARYRIERSVKIGYYTYEFSLLEAQSRKFRRVSRKGFRPL